VNERLRQESTINIRIEMNSSGIGHFLFMNTMFSKSTAHPYLAKKSTKPINFYCTAPSAQSVYLIGDFNAWDPTSHPMRRRVDGWWFIEVQLAHGHHRYQFLVDDKPTLDPQAAGTARNERNEKVSLLAVS